MLVNIIGNYCCTRRCKQKLKMEKQDFFVRFFIDDISIKGGGTDFLFLFSLATPMI